MRIFAPVVPTQTIYRQLLQAMSRPGRLCSMPAGEYWPSARLSVAETLLDHEVGFHILGGPDAQYWTDEIFAATKADRRNLPEADYIFLSGPDSGGRVREAKRGEPEYPDRSATLIYVLPAAEGQRSSPVRLRGPGICGEIAPEFDPLPESEWRLLSELNSEFPLGVDSLFLLGDCQVMGLPRSTRIRIGE